MFCRPTAEHTHTDEASGDTEEDNPDDPRSHIHTQLQAKMMKILCKMQTRKKGETRSIDFCHQGSVLVQNYDGHCDPVTSAGT